MPEISTYVNSLSSATLDGTEEVYLASDEKTTAQDIANLNGAFATTVLNIGDWDMVATESVSINHGIADYTKIRQVTALIIPDVGPVMVDLTFAPLASSYYPSGAISIGSTSIVLSRVAGRVFDATGYDATSFNRGYITITYAL